MNERNSYHSVGRQRVVGDGDVVVIFSLINEV